MLFTKADELTKVIDVLTRNRIPFVPITKGLENAERMTRLNTFQNWNNVSILMGQRYKCFFP